WVTIGLSRRRGTSRAIYRSSKLVAAYSHVAGPADETDPARRRRACTVRMMRARMLGMVTGSPIFSFRLAIALTTALGTAACASSSSVPELPGAVVVVPSVDTRVGWVLRLEQQRILRDGPPPVVEPVTDPAASNQGAEPTGPVPAEGSAPQSPVFVPAMSADLALLVHD